MSNYIQDKTDGMASTTLSTRQAEVLGSSNLEDLPNSYMLAGWPPAPGLESGKEAEAHCQVYMVENHWNFLIVVMILSTLHTRVVQTTVLVSNLIEHPNQRQLS